MKHKLLCPGCSIDLRFDTLRIEEAGVCPACEHLVLAPRGAKSVDDDEAVLENAVVREVVPVEDRIGDLQREAKSLAREHGIHIDENFRVRCESKDEADRHLAYVKQDLPEVPSAYEPSGAMPASAFVYMLSGTVVAVAVGAVAETVVLAIGAAVMALLTMLLVAMAALACIWCFGVVIYAIVGIIAYLAPFVVGAWACAWVITEAGRLGKNRNTAVAALLSMAAAAGSVFVMWGGYLLFGQEPLVGLNPFELGRSNLHLIVNMLMGVGALVAVAVAYFSAADMVRSAKFCEKCVEFMDEKALRSLHAGAIKTMAQAISDGKMPIAASVLGLHAGEDGKAALFACPCCGAGYVELTVDVKTKWPTENGEEGGGETWRVASAKLDKYEVQWFRIFKGDA